MTITIIASNSIFAGVGHSFAAAGDELIVVSGVTYASTNNRAVAFTSLGDLSVNVLGTMVSATIMQFDGAGVEVTIGQGGSFISREPISGNAGLFLSTGGEVSNYGQILAANTIGILGDDLDVENYGIISAASGVMIGLSGSFGGRVVNGGLISSNAYDDAGRNFRFNNGVILEAKGEVSNLAGGRILASSSEGAGIRVNKGAGGSVIKNEGLIQSSQDWGVNLSTVYSGQSLIIVRNWGEIAGGDGAFLGTANDDSLLNRGRMVGDVNMGAGNDLFDNRLGQVFGDWYGGDGSDTYQGTLDSHVWGAVFGGAGDDLLVGGQNEDFMLGDDDADRLYGREGDDSLHGDAGADYLYGEGGNDTLNGGADVDVTAGGLGDDTYFVDRSGDVIVERAGEGIDTVYVSSNYVMGENVEIGIINVTGNRSLTGNAANNTLVGNAGADTLIGGLGADVLTGGGGADRFKYNAVEDSAWAVYDTITDLQAADIIDLSAIDANTLVAGDQAFVKVSAFTGVAGQVRLVYSSSSGDTYVHADVNGDGVGDFRIRLTGNHTTWDNFVL